jgi:glycine/D-amino acid oxidase-like deaminating enzyme
MTLVMASTPDSLPHVGKVPGRENQWILAGFNGGGMPIILLAAKGIAQMVLHGNSFENLEIPIPRLFKTTKERLDSKAQIAA